MTTLTVFLRIIEINTSSFLFWVIIAMIIVAIIALIFLFIKVTDFVEENAIEITTGKLYILTKKDFGKIFLARWVFYKNHDDKNEGAIGIAFMREDGKRGAKWYQLPCNSEGNPVTPSLHKRSQLEPAGEYFYFKEAEEI